MSIIIAPIAKPVTVSKAMVKLLAGRDIAGIAAAFIPYADDAKTTPSDVRQGKAGALALLGSKPSAHSIIQGLTYLVACHAWGSKADTMAEKLPAVKACALTAACDTLKRGAGTDCASLKLAVAHGIASMLALPLTPTKDKSRAALEDKTKDKPETETETEAEAEAEAETKADAIGAAIIAASKRAAELAAEEGDECAKLYAFQHLAEHFGIKLTTTQVRALDKIQLAA